MKEDPANKLQWFTGQREHEGFPLMLRFQGPPDIHALRKLYPKLLTITQELSRVRPNGMPEPEYNDSLADFDHEIVNAFEQDAAGLTVLVETFGGRRNYYQYVSTTASLDAVKTRIFQKYSDHVLKWNLRDDAEWNFIRRYSEEYKFYK